MTFLYLEGRVFHKMALASSSYIVALISASCQMREPILLMWLDIVT